MTERGANDSECGRLLARGRAGERVALDSIMAHECHGPRRRSLGPVPLGAGGFSRVSRRLGSANAPGCQTWIHLAGHVAAT
jgi:hypothetical protein